MSIADKKERWKNPYDTSNFERLGESFKYGVKSDRRKITGVKTKSVGWTGFDILSQIKLLFIGSNILCDAVSATKLFL